MPVSTSALRDVAATRYVTPLREGGSLPGLVEADDDGLYVTKFRGAGQGLRALVAEVIVGELARGAGLLVPELVTVAIDARLGAAEPDPEIQELITASEGTNLGVDFLPGALPTRPPGRGSRLRSWPPTIVWLDALATNVDRTARNPNLLLWHERLWLIDHGAALYLQHGGLDRRAHRRRPFPLIAEHVLLARAGSIVEADERMRSRLGERGGRGRGRPGAPRVVRRRRRARRRTPIPDPAAGRRRVRGGGRACPNPDAKPVHLPDPAVVPSVERGERLNVGVVLFCRQRGFLGARVELDPAPAGALAPACRRPSSMRTCRRSCGWPRARPTPARSPRCPSPSASAGWPRRPARSSRPPRSIRGCRGPGGTLDALFARLVAAVRGRTPSARRVPRPRGEPALSAATHQPADRIHQLGGLLVALLRGVGADDAMVGVVVEQPERHLVQRRARGRDLREHVDAVAVLLDHALDPADLTLDPLQPRQQLVLGGGVSASRCHGADSIPLPPRGIVSER